MKVKNVQRIISSIEEELSFYASKKAIRGSFSSRQVAIQDTESQMRSVADAQLELNHLYYSLRKMVGKFNSQSIDDRTADIARLKARMAIYEDALKLGCPMEQGAYGAAGKTYTAGVSVEYEAECRNHVKNIKRQVQRLKDSCAGINANSDIELDEETIKIIKHYNLTDEN